MTPDNVAAEDGERVREEHRRALRYHARRISSGRDRPKGAHDDECITCWGYSGHPDTPSDSGFGFENVRVVDELRDWGLIEIRDHDWKNCMTRLTDAGWKELSS